MLRNDKPATTDTIAVNTYYRLPHRLLSLIPVSLAMRLHDAFANPSAEQGRIKQFIGELKEGLHVAGSSPDFVANLIPKYLSLCLASKYNTGELVAFQQGLEHELTHAYNKTFSEAERDIHKARAFKTIMLNMGSLGLKYMQTMRPKNPNSWIGSAIETAQSDLPAVSISTIETLMKEAFRKQGSLKYVRDFSKHFEVLQVLGAGTVGIAALVKFRDNPAATPEEIVVKILRPNMVTQFLNDYERLQQAITTLQKTNKATTTESTSFTHFLEQTLEDNLREANPHIGIANLESGLYEGFGVTTIKGNLDLVGKSHGLIFMKKASGKGFNKFLKENYSKIFSSEATAIEKHKAIEQLYTSHQRYITLLKLHLNLMADNKSVHADLHKGNIFYDATAVVTTNISRQLTGLLTVIDLDAKTRVMPTAEQERLKHFFIGVYLSAFTGRAHYIEFYYRHFHTTAELGNQAMAPEKIKQAVTAIQVELDRAKQQSQQRNIVAVDQLSGTIINVIANLALTVDTAFIPNALRNHARSSQAIGNQLEEYQQIFAGTSYANKIPYTERTMLAISLSVVVARLLKQAWSQRPRLSVNYIKAKLQEYYENPSFPALVIENGEVQLADVPTRPSEITASWIRELWQQGQSSLRTRLENQGPATFGYENGEVVLTYPEALADNRLHFKKKYIYGVLGFNEREAAQADILVPVAIITIPILTKVAIQWASKTVKTYSHYIPDFASSYRFLQTMKATYGSQISLNQLFSKIRSQLPQPQASPSLQTGMRRFQQQLHQATPRQTFTLGVAAGAALVYYGLYKPAQKAAENTHTPTPLRKPS